MFALIIHGSYQVSRHRTVDAALRAAKKLQPKDKRAYAPYRILEDAPGSSVQLGAYYWRDMRAVVIEADEC